MLGVLNEFGWVMTCTIEENQPLYTVPMGLFKGIAEKQGVEISVSMSMNAGDNVTEVFAALKQSSAKIIMVQSGP